MEDLKQENERLNRCLLEALRHENEALNKSIKFKDENERLRKQIEYDSRYNDMQAEIDCGERLITKYKICLQEIKAIVCGNYEIIDPQGRKDILKLINKTEVE